MAINPIFIYKKDDRAIVDAIRQLRTQLDFYNVEYVLVTPNDFDRYLTVKQRLLTEMKVMLSDSSEFTKVVESGDRALYRVLKP